MAERLHSTDTVDADPIITLDVGGSLMKTRRSTLTCGSRFFENMFSDKFKCPGDNIFIDCDAEAFRFILNYLRHKKLDRDAPLYRVKNVAEMLCMEDLLEQIIDWERLQTMVGTWFNMNPTFAGGFNIFANGDSLQMSFPNLMRLFAHVRDIRTAHIADARSVNLTYMIPPDKRRNDSASGASGDQGTDNDRRQDHVGSDEDGDDYERNREYYFFEAAMTLPSGAPGRLIVSLEPATHNNDNEAFIIGNQRVLFVCTALTEGTLLKKDKRDPKDIREEHNKLDWTIQCLAVRSEVTSFGHAANQDDGR